MARNWTKQQLEAIMDRGHNLLVSAGAGSGKTAVLTERIIRRLCDNENPAEITRMLVVTFTKAAAAELKARISSALNEQLAHDPANRRLARQLLQLDRAKICTIHSFCLDLLREHFAMLGIPANFRVADDAESKLLRQNLMDELIEDYYTAKSIPSVYAIDDFGRLADSLVGIKADDKLADKLLKLYTMFESYRDSIGFLEKFANELETDASCDFGESRCGQVTLRIVSERLEYYRGQLADALPDLMNDDLLSRAYLPAIEQDIDYIREVIRLCSNQDYAGLFQQMNSYSAARLGAVRGASDDVKAIKDKRDRFKKERDRLAKKFCSLTPEKIAAYQQRTADMLLQLYRLLALFDERIKKEKHRRAIVDFSDLERLAYKLLVASDGRPTDTARSTSELYDEIYIDEYQDVNSVQDAIFAAVSRENNRFMVGDVKQSIYGFRGAEPDIFQSYRQSYPHLGDAETVSPSGYTIYLSDNFRCDKEIIEFTNLVSERLFTNATGALPYYPEDGLVHSKSGVEQGIPVKLLIVGNSDDSDDDADSGSDSDDYAADTNSADNMAYDNNSVDDSDNEDIPTAEAICVANEIKKLLAYGKKDDGSPIRPSDIAILMRSAKTDSEPFCAVLEAAGIPVYNNLAGDFFENAEILLALCLINTIDNPGRDIYLAGLLKSQLFEFTLDELILIRRHVDKGSLYDALSAYTIDTDFEKGRRFLEFLSRWQDKARRLPVDRLLWQLYLETDLPALVRMGDSTRRRANLYMLYEYARRFESSSFKGLYNFIRYINDLIAKGARLEDAKVYSDASDTVKLMTIHQSKGLEFPVVFICGCAKKFNDRDLNENIVVEPKLGAAVKLLDSTGFARCDTPVRQAISAKLADSLYEEEMRVLYVAMTRARERLYLTGKVAKPQKLIDECRADAARLSRLTVLRNGGFLRWVLTAIFDYEASHAERPYTIELIDQSTLTRPDESGKNAPDTDDKFDNNMTTTISTSGVNGSITSVDNTSDDLDLDRIIHERFDFEYPHKARLKLPAKLSVSELYPTILDDDDPPAKLPKSGFNPTDATDDGIKKPTVFTSKLPLFMSDKAADAGSAAERGTATHLFMQFCDFDRLDCTDKLNTRIDDECARLTEQRFITPRIASLINKSQLRGFFQSRIFSEIRASRKVYREYRFNCELPANEFTADPLLASELIGEKILVQGVIDCFFVNSDGDITLLDYKTDYIPRIMPRGDAVELLRSRHKLQLGYYRAACEAVSAKRVSRLVIYAFGLGCEIEL